MFLSTGDFKQISEEAEPTEVLIFIDSTIQAFDKVVATYDDILKVIRFLVHFTKNWSSLNFVL